MGYLTKLIRSGMVGVGRKFKNNARRAVIRAPFTTFPILLACLAGFLPGLSLAAAAEQNPPPDVPAHWWGAVQKDIALSEYHVTWQEKTILQDVSAAYQAPNRAQDLRTYFTPEGPRVVRRTETEPAWVWGLELLDAPAVVEMNTNGNRIEHKRGDGLTEWYVNDPRGLEQGFTISEPQRHQDTEKDPVVPLCLSGEISIDLAVRGNLIPGMIPGGQTIEFLSPGGVGVIHYGHLKVRDATGRELPARIELARQDEQDLQDVAGSGASNPGNLVNPVQSLFIIRLVVDADAVYPITIDPLATSAAWTAEGNRAMWTVECASLLVAPGRTGRQLR